MGRMIKVDIDDMLALFNTYGCGGVMPSDIFDIIGDCTVTDIDEYAKTYDKDYESIKSDIFEMFKSYMANKIITMEI